jgi:hypothetical protein
VVPLAENEEMNFENASEAGEPCLREEQDRAGAMGEVTEGRAPPFIKVNKMVELGMSNPVSRFALPV